MLFLNPVFRLITLLLNELNAPEILPYDYDILSFFRELVNYQRILVSMQNRFSVNEDIKSILKKMEIDRIDYIIRSYHRVRLSKLEINLSRTNNKTSGFKRLHLYEKSYFLEYTFLCKNFVNNCFLDFLPREVANIIKYNVAEFNHRQSVSRDSYVFFRVFQRKQFIDENIFGMKNECELIQKNIYCIKFNYIKRLVYSGVVFLI
nr:DNA replication complex GINS protein sld5 [Cryptomonas sp.]